MLIPGIVNTPLTFFSPCPCPSFQQTRDMTLPGDQGPEGKTVETFALRRRRRHRAQDIIQDAGAESKEGRHIEG